MKLLQFILLAVLLASVGSAQGIRSVQGKAALATLPPSLYEPSVIVIDTGVATVYEFDPASVEAVDGDAVIGGINGQWLKISSGGLTDAAVGTNHLNSQVYTMLTSGGITNSYLLDLADGSAWLESLGSKSVVAQGTNAAGTPLVARGAVGHTGYIFQAQASNNATLFGVGPTGAVTATLLSAPLSWTNLFDVPAGFADGIDDGGGLDEAAASLLYQGTNENLTLLANAGPGNSNQFLQKGPGNLVMQWVDMPSGTGLTEGQASLLYQGTNANLTRLAAAGPGNTNQILRKGPGNVVVEWVDLPEYQPPSAALSNLTAGTELTVTTANITTLNSDTQNAGTLVITNNVRLTPQTTVSNLVDMLKTSSMITVGGNIAYTHVTNGVASETATHVVWLRNWSGTTYSLTIPSGWRTNLYSPVPPNLTNGWLTKMYVETMGATGDAANQTNAIVSFDHIKL